MIALAAAGSHSAGPWVTLLAIVVIGSGIAAAFTMIIIRLMRRGEPREKRLSRLAARLDGRSRVAIRMVEFGVPKADLIWVAQSRGYVMSENRFGKYYEFFRMPHQPGRYG